MGRNAKPEKEDAENFRDPYCDDCFFYGNSYGMRYCSYLLRTNHKRPCPPGKDCTVKVPMKVMRRKKEEIK